ncbi:heterokaryon incompatibility protein-domain-containing protein [Nemania serpens]|nr:heterokaryon incompatibility protein-domain-containing protein [Nemania serpens]
MRLLNTTESDSGIFTIEEFSGHEVQPYAILSHTWGEDEVSFQDMRSADAVNKKGYEKIKNCCSLAKANGYGYVWIDTCCIDKRSSAELSEAINSMYRWYQEADICYAYLADVPSISKLSESRWFTRGWTLQELIAPSTVLFFNNEWQNIGDKVGLQADISRITGIPSNFLLGDSLGYASVAQRMSWAANRKTTRTEDMAYCLLGIFDIYMPMLYGEGEKAFIRLQEEIMKAIGDHSLFAWRSTEYHGGILASSPAAFANSGNIVSTSSFNAASSPLATTSRGIHLSGKRTSDWQFIWKISP